MDQRFLVCRYGAVPVYFSSHSPPTGRWLQRNCGAAHYLPTKIKTPVTSAKTPITIAPMPT
jgi:hypothetical protein